MLRKTIIAVALLLAIVIIVPALGPMMRHPPQGGVLLEVQQLDDALEKYRAREGELFPSSGVEPILEHLRRIHPKSFVLENGLAFVESDLHSLDDAETLVLFLGEKLEKILGVPRNSCFEFSEMRLTDTDGDGWSEYSSPEGQMFRFDGQHPIVYCRSLKVWITAQPPERQQTKR